MRCTAGKLTVGTFQTENADVLTAFAADANADQQRVRKTQDEAVQHVRRKRIQAATQVIVLNSNFATATFRAVWYRFLAPWLCG